jgi:hypothetical protein
MNSEALFSKALGLQSPWQDKEATFSVADQALMNCICVSARVVQDHSLLMLFSVHSIQLACFSISLGLSIDHSFSN